MPEGTVEVWLDSIETGDKIAECAISGTGDWNTFETFKAAVGLVQGRHDVYLRFTGAGTGRLFKLKWIQFTAENGPELVSASVSQASDIRIAPNPAQSEIQVSWSSFFNELTIYSIEGREVLRVGFGTPQLTASVQLGFDSGVYLLLVKNEREWGIEKVILN